MSQAKSVAIIMGSRSDWPTMKGAADSLESLGVGYEVRIVSALRTPERLYSFARGASAAGFKIIIAGAGGAAHLPGMTASLTDLPVLGVPIQSKALNGLDSLLSIVQMPAGVPVGALAVGEAGARNAGLLAAKILALSDPALADRLMKARADLVRGYLGNARAARAKVEADFPQVDSRVATVVGLVSRAMLKGLYRDATVFAYVPRAEGWGLPPVEALHEGSRVVASATTPSVVHNVEVVRVDPLDVTSIAEGLVAALGLEHDERSTERRRASVADLTWRNVALDHLAAWQ